MADEQTKVERIQQAIYDTLWATGAFAEGIPYGRDEIGKTPFFMVEAGPFKVPESDLGDGSPKLSVVTHEFQIDLYIPARGKGQEREDQQRRERLLATAVKALHANHRLGGACLKAQVRAGERGMFKSNNTFYAVTFTLAVDVLGW